MSSRAQRKRVLRDERKERELAARARAQRDRRLRLLGVAAAVAAVIVVVAILVSRSGDDDPGGGLGEGAPLAGVQEANRLFQGIPQRGAVLGDPGAPLRMVEFVDMQCPFCAEYSRDVLPTLVERYVRPGRMQIELLPLTFLGDDSVKGGFAASAASEQNRLWQFTDLFFLNQGGENSGYVTPEFLRDVASGAGLEPGPVVAAAETQQGGALLQRAEEQAGRFNVQSTPSFLLGRPGGQLRPVEVSALTPDAFVEQIDQALGR